MSEAMSNPATEIVLPQTYYLDNFWKLLSSVSTLYEDLLTPSETEFLRDFSALSHEGQCLYVRLLSRQGEVFRRDRVHYDEIPTLDTTCEELTKKNFLRPPEQAGIENLLPKMLRAELDDLCRSLCPKLSFKKLRKHQLITALCEHVEEQDLLHTILSNTDFLFLSRWEATRTFRLLFFGSLSYDLTDFVLQDLGIFRYESYPILRDVRLFSTRQAIDEVLMLSEIRSAVSLLLEASVLDDAIKWAEPVLTHEGSWCETSTRYVESILFRIGRELERKKRHQEALRYLERATVPPARERRARILVVLARYDEAFEICEQMIAAPRDEVEADVARRIQRTIHKKRGESVPKVSRKRRQQLTLSLVKDERNVEWAALVELERRQQKGFHGENALWMSLFGLAFWDIIFAPVRGAFQHPFQRGPLDLHRLSFRTLRETQIDARIERLYEGAGSALILRHAREKWGIANYFVHWEWLSLERLRAVLDVLPPAHLAAICDRLSRDIKRYRRGFPDLFVWTQQAPGYQLYEVKGPGDQLRPEQTSWLDFFDNHDIPAAILKVTWDTNTNLSLF
ncbi:MAG TPA: hypothetical protein DCE42_17740 [Myxococcales bacterium]|nr:hypothetical protein [Deltaproteobacteria bacterium]HAA56611.1 hypothetical protein [Myxococcales bacterium]